jgi:hypothetical protein
MAQFDFYGSWEDSRTYLEKLIHQQRFTFVIDMWYTERVPFLFKTLTEDTENVLQKHSRVYLWSDDYSRFPPGFGEPNSTGQMMIRPTEGGPALDLTFPHCFRHNEKFQLGSGMLFYQPTYHNPETGEWYKPPEALKQAYKEVQALLRKAMVKRYICSQTVTTEGIIKPIIMPLWIGSDAIKLLEAGMVEILFGRDDWKTGKDLAKTRSELEPLVDEYA